MLKLINYNIQILHGEKVLEKKIIPKTIDKEKNSNAEDTIRTENTVIAILLNAGNKAYEKIKDIIVAEDFKNEINKQILKKLYDEFEKGNSNTNNVLDQIKDENELAQITKIMADDYNIKDMDKAILDIINIYQKEKLQNKKKQILSDLENKDLTKEEIASLENSLSETIIKLAKFK